MDGMHRIPALILVTGSLILLGSLGGCSTTSLLWRPDAPSALASASLGVDEDAPPLSRVEVAVTRDPANAGIRTALAQSYVEQGRFISARESLEDALALGDRNPKTIITLALVNVALGRSDAALVLLDDNQSALSPSDLGLALAIAGNPGRAIDVLGSALRNGENTVRLRQNLAYAYALAGRWREAQIMLGEDLDPTAVDARITQWAKIVNPEAYVARAASVLGQGPIDIDPGQPTVLALNTASKNLVDPSSMNAEFALTGAKDAQMSADRLSPIASPETVPDLLLVMPISPIATPGRFAVQLGVFSSAANADKAWAAYRVKHKQLASLSKQILPLPAKGRTLNRLIADGIATEDKALSLCGAVRSSGGDCMVMLSRRSQR
jgi:cell division septation protein DedD